MSAIDWFMERLEAYVMTPLFSLMDRLFDGLDWLVERLK